MYTFSSKLKTFSYALMFIGIIGVAYGFFTTPSSVEDVKVMLQESHDTHGEVATHENDAHTDEASSHDSAHSDDAHAEHVFHLLKNMTGHPHLIKQLSSILKFYE